MEQTAVKAFEKELTSNPDLAGALQSILAQSGEGRDNLSPETERKLLEKIREHGYDLTAEDIRANAASNMASSKGDGTVSLSEEEMEKVAGGSMSDFFNLVRETWDEFQHCGTSLFC